MEKMNVYQVKGTMTKKEKNKMIQDKRKKHLLHQQSIQHNNTYCILSYVTLIFTHRLCKLSYHHWKIVKDYHQTYDNSSTDKTASRLLLKIRII